LLEQTTANLEGSFIEQATNPEGHGLFLPIEGSLLGGDPVNFLLGDDPGGQGFQIDLPQVHGRVMQNPLMVWATHAEARRVSESDKVGAGPLEMTG
jgi:hypothetical protein